MNTKSDTPRTDDFYCNSPENEPAYEFAQELERETNELSELLKQSLEYLEDHTDAGFIDQGFKSQKLSSLISKIEEKTK